MAYRDLSDIRAPNAEAAINSWFNYFDRLNSFRGLERAFSMATSFILAHPHPVRIHRQALQVACDLGMIRERKWHLKWIDEAEAFHRELPGEAFSQQKYGRWRSSSAKKPEAEDVES